MKPRIILKIDPKKKLTPEAVKIDFSKKMPKQVVKLMESLKGNFLPDRIMEDLLEKHALVDTTTLYPIEDPNTHQTVVLRDPKTGEPVKIKIDGKDEPIEIVVQFEAPVVIYRVHNEPHYGVRGRFIAEGTQGEVYHITGRHTRNHDGNLKYKPVEKAVKIFASTQLAEEERLGLVKWMHAKPATPAPAGKASVVMHKIPGKFKTVEEKLFGFRRLEEPTRNLPRNLKKFDTDGFLDLAIRFMRDMERTLPRNFVHADLKPDNIALHGDVSPSTLFDLTHFHLIHFSPIDMGTSVKINETPISEGTPLYSPPEQQTLSFPLTKKADVYSLILIMIEIAGIPNPFLIDDQRKRNLKKQTFKFKENDVKHLNLGPLQESFLEMLNKCIDPDPNVRMDLSKVIAELETIRKHRLTASSSTKEVSYNLALSIRNELDSAKDFQDLHRKLTVLEEQLRNNELLRTDEDALKIFLKVLDIDYFSRCKNIDEVITRVKRLSELRIEEVAVIEKLKGLLEKAQALEPKTPQQLSIIGRLEKEWQRQLNKAKKYYPTVDDYVCYATKEIKKAGEWYEYFSKRWQDAPSAESIAKASKTEVLDTGDIKDGKQEKDEDEDVTASVETAVQVRKELPIVKMEISQLTKKEIRMAVNEFRVQVNENTLKLDLEDLKVDIEEWVIKHKNSVKRALRTYNIEINGEQVSIPLNMKRIYDLCKEGSYPENRQHLKAIHNRVFKILRDASEASTLGSFSKLFGSRDPETQKFYEEMVRKYSHVPISEKSVKNTRR